MINLHDPGRTHGNVDQIRLHKDTQGGVNHHTKPRLFQQGAGCWVGNQQRLPRIRKRLPSVVIKGTTLELGGELHFRSTTAS